MPLLPRQVRVLLLAVSAMTIAMMSAPEAQAVPRGDYWSCVPYARQVSDIDLSGDAWRWWTAAAGVYNRGQTPKAGAVLVFKRTARLRQGHVAVVRQVINSRRIVVDHANWDRGRRKGRIDNGVSVLDVSPNNDWSQVRVWYTPVGDFGTTQYPTNGFIYSNKVSPQPAARASQPQGARMTPIPVSLPKPALSKVFPQP